MSEFVRGIVFAVGMYMFGTGMYGLGRTNAEKKYTKFLREMSDELEKSIKEAEEQLEGIKSES